MNSRGVRLLGRELDLPQTAAAVRARNGQTLVTDGPFAETKEFIAGFDVSECADLGEAIEVAATCPVSWFQAIKIRPFTGGLRLGEEAFAFGRGEDRGASPYLLAVWMGRTPAAPFDDQAVNDEGEAWRQDLAARGRYVLGNALGAGTRPRRSASATGTRCSATGRSPAPGSSSQVSTSSAALIGSRRSSSRPRIRSPGITRSRCARSIANDHSHRSARARCAWSSRRSAP